MVKADKLFAFITVDEEGNEGVAAFYSDSGWMPMVGRDISRVESLMKTARIIASETGIDIELREFSSCKLIEVIKGEVKGND